MADRLTMEVSSEFIQMLAANVMGAEDISVLIYCPRPVVGSVIRELIKSDDAEVALIVRSILRETDFID